MTNTFNLKEHKYSQCHVVVFDDGTIQFVSYDAPVIEIDPAGYVHVMPLFNCSATTRKQVGWFLREYSTIDYHTAKMLYANGLAMHRTNGDVIEEDKAYCTTFRF